MRTNGVASRTHRVSRHALYLLSLALAVTPTVVHCQTFPSKTVRIVMPLAAGGTGDALTRMLAQRLSPMWGQTVLVDNRLGSGGQIGAEIVARAPADGHTLVVGTVGIHAAYGIYTKLTYDPSKDLQPVALLTEVPNIVVVHPSLPARTLKDFLALAKARPGEINFGSAGVGSSTHMAGELFMLMAKVNLTHVPYKGSALALSDLLGGQIHAMFENMSSLPAHLAAGKLRGLAITSKTRWSALPDLPTVAEAGVPGYESTGWFTVAAPSKVPASIIHKLNADVNAVLRSQEMQPRLQGMGMTVLGGSPEQASRFFVSETEKWNKVIRAANIKAD